MDIFIWTFRLPKVPSPQSTHGTVLSLLVFELFDFDIGLGVFCLMKRVQCSSHFFFNWTIPNIQKYLRLIVPDTKYTDNNNSNEKSNFCFVMTHEHQTYTMEAHSIPVFICCAQFSSIPNRIILVLFFLLLLFCSLVASFSLRLPIWQQSCGALIQHPFLRQPAPTSLRLQFLRYCILPFCVHEMKHKWKCENVKMNEIAAGILGHLWYLWHQWHLYDISNTWYCVCTLHKHCSNSPNCVVYTISWHVQNCEMEMCVFSYLCLLLLISFFFFFDFLDKSSITEPSVFFKAKGLYCLYYDCKEHCLSVFTWNDTLIPCTIYAMVCSRIMKEKRTK